MKIEVNLQKKHFILVLSTILLLGGIAYALGQNPKIFGHKSSEIDWSEQLTQIKVTNLNVSKLCIGTECRTSWPSAGGATLPTCANQQVLKYDTSTNSWVCANDLDTDTDTRCDVSKKCSQLCIGTDCRTSWPSAGVTSINNRNGAVNIMGNNGVSVTTSGNTITISAPILTQCVYGTKSYTVGATCSLSCVNRGSYFEERYQQCTSTGWGSVQMDNYRTYCVYQLC